MTRKTRDLNPIRELVERASNIVCGCVKTRNGKPKADPKCKVCDGTGRPKAKLIQ